MKARIILLLTASLLFCGCSSQTAEERLDAASLQPYTNIAPGTLVLVQMRADISDYTHTNALGQPRRYDMPFGSEYIFEGISYGSVGLRMTNGTRTIFWAGKMIESIKPVRPNTALEPTPISP